MKINTLFLRDDNYINNVNRYTKKEGILAFVLFFVMIIFYTVLGFLYRIDFVKRNIILIGCIFNLLMVVISILFVRFDKRDLNSIGLKGGNIRLTIIMGSILAIIYFSLNFLQYIFQGYHVIVFKSALSNIFYYLLVALCEEVVFRGYINTRLYGLVNNRILVIAITGILFIFMHFPYRMVAYNVSFIDLITNFQYLFDLFITHVFLCFIYEKSNSLYGSILPHWISNLANSLILK